jgi:bud site selection protein 20
MGTGRGARKHGAQSKKKQYKRKVWLCRRDKDIDQIQDELERTGGEGPAFQYDDELPGGGQFYCKETGKHFIDAKALEDHKKSRAYKRRVKDLKEEKYTKETAEWAAGRTKERLPPAHPARHDQPQETA